MSALRDLFRKFSKDHTTDSNPTTPLTPSSPPDQTGRIYGARDWRRTSLIPTGITPPPSPSSSSSSSPFTSTPTTQAHLSTSPFDSTTSTLVTATPPRRISGARDWRHDLTPNEEGRRRQSIVQDFTGSFEDAGLMGRSQGTESSSLRRGSVPFGIRDAILSSKEGGAK